MTEVLINPTVVIISQHIHASNHHIAYPILTQYYMPIIFIKAAKSEKNTFAKIWEPVFWFLMLGRSDQPLRNSFNIVFKGARQFENRKYPLLPKKKKTSDVDLPNIVHT